MDTGQGFELRDLLAVVRRRRAVIAIAAGLVFLASLLLAALLPNEYEAYATILVEPQTISQTLVQPSLEGTDLNARLGLMATEILSRSRLSPIIDELRLYPEESQRMTREEVIELMRGYIRVEPVVPEFATRDRRNYEINTFRVFFRHRDPVVAARVANEIADDFVEEHIRARTRSSGDTSAFVEAELTRLATRIQQVEERIAEVKSTHSGSLPDDLRSNQLILERAYDRLREAERSLSEAEGNEAFFRQQLLSAVADPRDPVSPEQRLELLELELAELRSRGFTDKHPDVVATLSEMEHVRATLFGQADGDGRPKSVAQQTAEAEARRAGLRAAAARQEIQRLRAQIHDLEARIARAPRVAEQLDGLSREYNHLYQSYQDFSAKRLEATVAANMELQVKGERFRVLESAVPPLEPTSPHRPLLLLLGALLGLALGGGLAALLEANDRSFHSAGELQAALRAPVLASIPAILLDVDRQALRQRRRRAALLASLVVLLFLILSGGGYWWVNGSSARPPSSGDEARPWPTAPGRS